MKANIGEKRTETQLKVINIFILSEITFFSVPYTRLRVHS